MKIGAETRCLVTGATSGMGYEIALALLLSGASVIAHGRSAAAIGEAAARLEAAVPQARLSTVHADLSEAAGLDDLLAQIPDQPIDLLVNNAGAAFASSRRNAAGIERTVWINHFIPLMLTTALLDRIGRGAVVATVSSASVGYVSVDPATGDVDGRELEPGYTQLRAYGVSKLLNLGAMGAFGRGVKDGPVMILVDPGGIQTDFARKAGETAFLDMTLSHWNDCVSAAEAARQLIRAVTRDDLMLGGLYHAGKPVPTPPGAHDEAFGDRILSLSRSAIAGCNKGSRQ